jgi:hypothetical protein
MHDLALSFYMHDPDKRLPGLDEILVCQKDTPLEQVGEIIGAHIYRDVNYRYRYNR